MTEIISVRFKPGGKQYYFDPGPLQIRTGQGVILDTSRGSEYGVCVRGNTTVEDAAVVQPLRSVIRVATERDDLIVARNREREQEAFQICRRKIEEHGLNMKLVEAECSFDGNKILFFFTSEHRIDFRQLVKDLASALHARIELRQIGVRDEAKLLGGLGGCGQPFCCATFLDEFQPVSIKMAKSQSLSLNPTKISGTCGRLMCCLKYEQDAYEDAIRRCPKTESFVETPDGVGTVVTVNLLREMVKVRLDDSAEPPKQYRNCEISVVRSGKGKLPEGYVPPPKAELEARRYIPEGGPEATPAVPKTALSMALESILSSSSDAAPQKSAPGGAPRQGGKRKGGGSGSGKRPPQPPAGKQADAPPRQAEQGAPQKPEEKKKSNRRRWYNKGKGKGPANPS